MKKILVLCDYGEVRSVAMAKLLRERGHFAVSGSYDNAFKVDMGRGVLESFFDHFLYLEENGKHFIGRDLTGDVDDPEYRKKCIQLCEELGL